MGTYRIDGIFKYEEIISGHTVITTDLLRISLSSWVCMLKKQTVFNSYICVRTICVNFKETFVIT